MAIKESEKEKVKARKAAQKAGLRTMGVAGFLLIAKQKDLIKEIRPLLEALQQRDFRLSQALIEAVSREAGELSKTQ
jgi:predicted nucleic acid-binding protein